MFIEPLPPRLKALAQTVEAAIEALPGVTRASMWGSRNFKVGKKLFVCYGTSPAGLVLEFKLPPAAARAALATGIAEKHGFRTLAASGWIAVRLTRKRDVPRVLAWVGLSRTLYPGAEGGRRQ